MQYSKRPLLLDGVSGLFHNNIYRSYVKRLLNILKCIVIFFAGTNLYNLVNVVYEDLTITDMSGVQSLLGSFNNILNRNLADNNLDLNLR